VSWAMQTVSEIATSVPDLQGEWYLSFMQRLHGILQPATYFEVGTSTGDSLVLSQCPSIAVDPAFRLSAERVGPKPICAFYQMTSDAYFAAHSPSALFGRPIDLAFLDGLHLAEALLRDFINTERHCKPNSVVMLHDCIPTDTYIAERVNSPERRESRSAHPGWWTGDVWKVLPILRRMRPDLSIHALDASCTGLVMITNLDPGSTVLSDTYAASLREMRAMDLATYGLERFIAEQEIESTASYQTFEDISARFWL